MFDPEKVYPVFAGTWAVLGVVSAVMFFIIKDGWLRQRLWYVTVLVIGVLFVFFVYLMDGLGHMLLVSFVGIGLVTTANLMGTRFCASCGKMNISYRLFCRPRKCCKCGAELGGRASDQKGGRGEGAIRGNGTRAKL